MSDESKTLQSQVETLQAQVEKLTAQIEDLQQKYRNMTLGGDPTQAPALVCRKLNVVHQDGTTALHLGRMGGGGGSIMLHNSAGKTQITIQSGDDRNLIFFGSPTKPALRIGMHQEHGFMEVYQPDGILAAAMRATPRCGVFCITDKTGKPRVLISNRDDAARMEIYGPDFQLCGAFIAVPSGGMLALSAPGEQPTAILGAADGFSTLTLGEKPDDEDEDRETQGINLMVGPDISALHVIGPGEAPMSVNLTAHTDSSSLTTKNGADEETISLMSLDDGGHFELNDAEGETRVSASVFNDGAALALDSNGEHGLFLQCDSKSSRLSLQTEDQPKVLLTANESGGSLHLTDANGEASVLLERNDQGGVVAVSNGKAVHSGLRCGPNGGMVFVQDQENHILGSISIAEEGARLDLHATDGARRVLALSKEGGGQLAVLNDAGAPRVIMGVGADHGQFIVSASGGEKAALISGSPDGGAFVLFDADGELELSLPEREDY